MSQVDSSPAEVRGPIPGVRASRARVVWREGMLYVATASNKVRAYEAPDAPVLNGNMWSTGGWSWYRSRCGTCSFSLGQVPVSQLIAAAKVSK
jgi:hypothetical protein